MARLEASQFIVQILLFSGVVHGIITWIAVRLPLEVTISSCDRDKYSNKISMANMPMSGSIKERIIHWN